MGEFSFECKESGLPVASGDACRIFLLKDGKVIEEQHGHNSNYGNVDDFEWKMDWGDVCDLMFSRNKGDGLAVVLDKYWTGKIPTTQSESDPDQGWGRKNGGVKVKEPYHKVY